VLPEELDRICHENRPRLIFCTPTIQNPTTATMSVSRRQAIVDIARLHELPILEDDAYGLFPTEPLPALARLAPELVFHLATFAKTLSPGLRLAYLVVPTLSHVDRLTAALRATAQMGSALMASIVTGWIRDGDAQRLFKAIRQETAARQDMADTILAGLDTARHPNGLHLWLSLPQHWHSSDFTAYARRHGLALVAEDSFAVDAATYVGEHVRIALGAAQDRGALAQALMAIEAALRRPVPQAYTAVI
jgi:DNA-binding transcriptional MocR family regulator